MVAESLHVGNPGNNARDLPDQADPTHECQIVLSVEDIRPYEHNPRRTHNARFNDIKASIRASGLRNPFTVTRRPGESHFVVEAGGNTRLLAIRQLWAETREPRFHKLACPVSALALGKSRAYRPPDRERSARRHELLGQGQRGRRSQGTTRSGAGHHVLPATDRRSDEGAGPRHQHRDAGPLPVRHRAADYSGRGRRGSVGPRRQADATAAEWHEAPCAGARIACRGRSVRHGVRAGVSRGGRRVSANAALQCGGGVPGVRGGAGRGTRRICCRTAQGARSGGTIAAGLIGFFAGAGSCGSRYRGGRGRTEGD